MALRLDDLIDATRERLDRVKRELPLAELERAAATQTADRPFSEALSRPWTSLIAEYKRRSPSAGEIRADLDVADVVRAYDRGGAAALSILTDERHFGGSLEDLRRAREVTDLPILRKDFTIDPYMLFEAKAYGADAVLLVVGALKKRDLAALYDMAHDLELDAIVEVHDEEELECALEIDCDVIGINNRNLEDFSVSLDTTYELLTDVPAGKTVVSESGISTRQQIEELERVGVDAVLVGETLMRAPAPEVAARELSGGEEPTQA
jgi:indole-3-glycerol phosphate synthase